jgi:hypothetical protein
MKSSKFRYLAVAILAVALGVFIAGPLVMASTQAQGDHLGYQQDHGLVAPSHAAATATEDVEIYIAQRACRVKRIDFAARAAITGTATNYTDIAIFKNGAGGSGGTAMGSAISYQSGTNTAANTKTNLYAPTTPINLAAGDRVVLRYSKTGTGLLIPDLFVQVVTDFEP